MEKNQPRISLIAAMAKGSRTIGKEGGGIPWHIKEDFKYFKDTTMGHPMIMGRKTWEQFGGRPLPGRTHIVISQNSDYKLPEGLFLCNSIESAIKKAKEIEVVANPIGGEIFIIGGAQIYELGLQFADRIYLTVVDTNVEGPAKFPDYGQAGFNKIISSRKSSEDEYKYEFLVLEK